MTSRRAFRFGAINETVLPPAAWLDHARRIEELGYATFLIRDHLLPDFFGPQLAPIPALMAAACATSTLRVGTMVFANDFRHPAVLAKELATLDLLSGGRLEIGIGAGWLRAEYAAAGLPYEPAGRRIARLDEAVTVLKGLFADGPLTYAGEHYAISELDSFPKPAQRPHPPIFMGGGKRGMLTLAGRQADIVGLLTSSVGSGVVVADPAERLAATVRQKLAWVREGAGARYADLELSLIPGIYPAADRERRAAELIADNGWDGISVADVLAMPSMLLGTPDEMADDLIRRREEYGFSYYVVSDDEAEAFAPVVARLAGR